MKTKNIAVPAFTLAILSAAAPLALAQGSDAPAWYAGATLGKSTANDACTGVTSTCDDTGAAWRILGGYQFNRNWAAELGYHRFGKAAVTGTPSAELKTSAFELVGVGTLPLQGSLSLYGKAGYVRGKSKFTSNAGNVEGTSNGYTWGFGFRYDFSSQFALRAEFQKYADVGGNNGSDVSVFGLGALMTFR